MPRREATPEQKNEIRRAIRRAAAIVYNREGQSGISVRAIAKEAEVSIGTIYTYFGNLQGLLESLWNGPVERLAEELRTISQKTPDPLQRIRALLASYLAFARENAEIYRGVFLFVRPLGNPSAIKEPAENATLPALLSEAIAEGQAQGQIKSGEPDELAMILWGSLHGCLALPSNFGRLEFSDPDHITSGVIDFVMGGLKA